MQTGSVGKNTHTHTAGMTECISGAKDVAPK